MELVIKKIEKVIKRRQAELNHRPIDLQSIALPLSYVSDYIITTSKTVLFSIIFI